MLLEIHFGNCDHNLQQERPTSSRILPAELCLPELPATRLSSASQLKMSQPHFAYFALKRPWLLRIMMPMAKWYCNASGYRKLGLR
jgi:hypothetical protein